MLRDSKQDFQQRIKSTFFPKMLHTELETSLVMIFFLNKGINIIYLYFVNILYIYLRRNCEIFKFFFSETWKISAAAHQTSLFEVGTFVHSGSHIFYLKSIRFQIQLCHMHGFYLNLIPPKKIRKFNFLWVCKQETLIFGHFFITFLAFEKYLKQ